KRRADEVDSPRREAANHARDLALKLREAKQSLTLPKQPADTAALSAHTEWVARIIEQAKATAGELQDEATAAESSAGEAAKAADEVLKAATEVVERELLTADEFE